MRAALPCADPLAVGAGVCGGQPGVGAGAAEQVSKGSCASDNHGIPESSGLYCKHAFRCGAGWLGAASGALLTAMLGASLLRSPRCACRGQIRFFRKGQGQCTVKLTISYEVPSVLAPFANVSGGGCAGALAGGGCISGTWGEARGVAAS